MFQRLEEKAAVLIVNTVGSMRCALFFSLFSLSPLLWPSLTAVVSYTSSAFLQLVLLSIIMVGQDVKSRAADARAWQVYSMMQEELLMLRRILANEAVVTEGEAE